MSSDDQEQPSEEAGTPVFHSPTSPPPSSSLPMMIHSTPLQIRSQPGGQRGGQLSQSTPIPGINQPRVQRGDLGRTPSRPPRDLRVIPLTPMDESSSSQRSASLPPQTVREPHAGHEMDTEGEEILADVEAGEAMRAEAQIWGTEISVQNCINVFQLFLQSFRTHPSEAPYYTQVFLQLHATGGRVLNLDCQHLRQFATTRVFYDQLVRYPQEIVPLLDRVASQEYTRVVNEQLPPLEELDESAVQIQVRPCSLAQKCRLRDLDPEHIDSLVSLQGMVLRCSSVIPDLKVALFRCTVCAVVVECSLDRGRIEEPASCPHCQAAGVMDVLHNRCAFSDKQLIRLQESPDEIPAGETPYTATLFAFDDLVDSVRPGDRVQVTGIFRAVMKRVNPRQRNVQSVFKTYIDAIHFQPLHGPHGSSDGGRAVRPDVAHAVDHQDEDEEVEEEEEGMGMGSPPPTQEGGDRDLPAFSADQVASFRQFAAQRDVYDQLVRLFAPSVYGLDDVKKGLLCLLFGGTTRNRVYHTLRRSQRLRERRAAMAMAMATERGEGQGEEKDDDHNEEDEEDEDEGGEGVHLRGDINILLCGDPGTSKSQLLGYVHRLSHRGIYTSGKGSSAVGLTASVVRDVETRELVLESGALVLSDQGICCIDEFDKMSEQTRAILHEAMEQQTVSITKAGIIATLHARTSILASANPAQSRYNPRLSVLENIQLPPTLISRFDLIYLVLDKPDKEQDRRLARHLVSLYYDGPSDDMPDESAAHDPHGAIAERQAFLRSYILYARHYVFPEISREAEPVLTEAYLRMRSLGSAHYAANLSGGTGSAPPPPSGWSARRQHNITATPRQLESLIRLSQALAKMRLSAVVSAEDVHEAVRLMKVATHTAAIDPRTGTIDMDILTTGRSSVDRDLTGQLADYLADHVLSSQRHAGMMSVAQIRQWLVQSGRMQQQQQRPSAGMEAPSFANHAMLQQVSMGQVEAALRELQSRGLLVYNEARNAVKLNHS